MLEQSPCTIARRRDATGVAKRHVSEGENGPEFRLAEEVTKRSSFL